MSVLIRLHHDDQALGIEPELRPPARPSGASARRPSGSCLAARPARLTNRDTLSWARRTPRPASRARIVRPGFSAGCASSQPPGFATSRTTLRPPTRSRPAAEGLPKEVPPHLVAQGNPQTAPQSSHTPLRSDADTLFWSRICVPGPRARADLPQQACQPGTCAQVQRHPPCGIWCPCSRSDARDSAARAFGGVPSGCQGACARVNQADADTGCPPLRLCRGHPRAGPAAPASRHRRLLKGAGSRHSGARVKTFRGLPWGRNGARARQWHARAAGPALPRAAVPRPPHGSAPHRRLRPWAQALRTLGYGGLPPAAGGLCAFGAQARRPRRASPAATPSVRARMARSAQGLRRA